jgi:hypothetical protein
MKRAIAIFLAACFLVSCGPHRMRCGPRGICESQQKAPLLKIIPENFPFVVTFVMIIGLMDIINQPEA